MFPIGIISNVPRGEEVNTYVNTRLLKPPKLPILGFKSSRPKRLPAGPH